jgi:hypothetical protein
VALTEEQSAHARTVRLPTSEIVSCLQEILGQRLTAVIAGVSDAKAVGKWARGERPPHPATEKRLRAAYQVTSLLLHAETPETVRAWFVGMNPELDDQAPALVIRDDPVRVLQSARIFLAHG